MRNAVGKLTYDFSNDTHLALTAYNNTIWADSTGNGDTDYITYQQNAYNNPTAPATNSQTLPNGPTVTCNNSWVVLNDSPAGYECMSNQQYNQTFSGPSGGGLGRYHDGRIQDYHGRLQQRIGPTTLTVDAYVDNYGYDNVKGVYPHHHYTDIYRTHGALISDDFITGHNAFTLGAFLEHQQHVSTDVNASSVTGKVGPDLPLTATNYFLRDTFTPNSHFTAFLDLSAQKFHGLGSAYFDPRLSLVFRPTNSDVVRITGGRSTSIPDPSTIYGGFSFSDINSWNVYGCPSSGLISAGSGSSPALQPSPQTIWNLR